MEHHVHNIQARKCDLKGQRVGRWCKGTTRLAGRPESGWMATQASPIVVEEHVDHIFEEVRLLWGEEATGDLVDGMLQLGEPLVVPLGIVPAKEGLR